MKLCMKYCIVPNRIGFASDEVVCELRRVSVFDPHLGSITSHILPVVNYLQLNTSNSQQYMYLLSVAHVVGIQSVEQSVRSLDRLASLTRDEITRGSLAGSWQSPSYMAFALVVSTLTPNKTKQNIICSRISKATK